jgi:hypothetical protein
VDSQPLRQKFLNPKWKILEIIVNIVFLIIYQLV